MAAALIMPLRAEIVCALGPAASSYKADSDQRPSSDALQLANRVNAAVKTLCGVQCPTMALFRNPTAANAMLIADSGQAKLVYSPQFLAAAYDSFGDGGFQTVDTTTDENDPMDSIARAVTIQSDGNIVIAGDRERQNQEVT